MSSYLNKPVLRDTIQLHFPWLLAMTPPTTCDVLLRTGGGSHGEYGETSENLYILFPFKVLMVIAS